MTEPTTVPSRDQIAAVVRDYLASELKVEPASITTGAVLKELPGADSVRLVRVVSRLERHWDKEFDDEDIFASRTLDELIAMVHSYLDERR